MSKTKKNNTTKVFQCKNLISIECMINANSEMIRINYRPAIIYKETHIRLAKKKFPVKFFVFDQPWSQIYPMWRLISKKKQSIALLQNVSRFLIFYQQFFWMMLNRLLHFDVKHMPKFQHFAALARISKRMWPSVGMI
jgi:hypothetical protein